MGQLRYKKINKLNNINKINKKGEGLPCACSGVFLFDKAKEKAPPLGAGLDILLATYTNLLGMSNYFFVVL